MRHSLIKDKLLPENLADYKQLEAEGKLYFTHCFGCRREFKESNTASAEGWRETQISGMCEPCYDELFKDDWEEETLPKGEQL